MEQQKGSTSKEMIWALRWSVALRTFYRQILSLLYSSFPFGNFRPRLVRALLVYIYIYVCCMRSFLHVKLPAKVPSLRAVVLRLDYLDDLCGAPLLPKEARHRRGAAPPRPPRKTETGADGPDVELYPILGSHHGVCNRTAETSTKSRGFWPPSASLHAWSGQCWASDNDYI